MARKSFQTYTPTEQHELDINGTVFHMKPNVPGDLLLDFISGANTDDPGAMATVVRNLLDAAIVDTELEAWHTYIRDPKNNVTLDVLSEIAGFASEVLAGGNPQQRPVSSLTG